MIIYPFSSTSLYLNQQLLALVVSLQY